MNVNENYCVNVNVGVRVTVSARMSVTGIARARRDLPNAVGSAQIHAGLSKSMWRGRGPGTGRFARTGLGTTPLGCSFACPGQ